MNEKELRDYRRWVRVARDPNASSDSLEKAFRFLERIYDYGRFDAGTDSKAQAEAELMELIEPLFAHPNLPPEVVADVNELTWARSLAKNPGLLLERLTNPSLEAAIVDFEKTQVLGLLLPHTWLPVHAKEGARLVLRHAPSHPGLRAFAEYIAQQPDDFDALSATREFRRVLKKKPGGMPADAWTVKPLDTSTPGQILRALVEARADETSGALDFLHEAGAFLASHLRATGTAKAPLYEPIFTTS